MTRSLDTSEEKSTPRLDEGSLAKEATSLRLSGKMPSHAEMEKVLREAAEKVKKDFRLQTTD